MDTNARVIQILQAQTRAELRLAMDGFYDEVIEAYPDLASSPGLKICLLSETYDHALVDVATVEGRTKREYPDAKHVLQAATSQQAALRQ